MSYIIKIKKEYRLAFFSALIVGILSHSFIFYNLNYYQDAIHHRTNLGFTFASGRWGLGIIEELNKYLLGNIQIPIINVGLSIIFLALTAVYIIKIFNIGNKSLCIFTGAILVVYPVVNAVFTYLFTAQYYFLSVLLSTIAVYLIKERKNIFHIFLAIILIAFSLGIYQAYFSIPTTLLLLILIKDILKGKDTNYIVRKGLIYLLILIFSMALYLVLNKIFLVITNTKLVSYNGLEEMGQLDISKIPSILVKIFKESFFKDFFRLYSIKLVKVLSLFLFFTYFIINFCIIYMKKINALNTILYFMLILIVPISINILYLFSTSDKYGIHIHSLYGNILWFIMLFISMDTLIKILNEEDNSFIKKSGRFIKVINFSILCLIMSYVYVANASHYILNVEINKLNNFFTTLSTRIQMVDGYKDEYPIYYMGPNKKKVDLSQELYRLSLPKPYSLRAVSLINYVYWTEHMEFLTGFKHKQIYDINNKIKNNEEVKNMTVYPDDGSIKIIDDVIVVKFDNLNK